MSSHLKDLEIFEKISPEKRIPLSIGMELTCRCNLDCRHCYINQPISHEASRAGELSIEEIDRISDQALALGTLWFKLSGGEVLVRKDFEEIYLLLKKKGFLVSILTNATLLQEKHVDLFTKYPPRVIEISAYGSNASTYEHFTGKKNGFANFMRGLHLCMEAGLPIILKTLETRSLQGEMADIEKLISHYHNGSFLKDDTLFQRVDNNMEKSGQILSLRLDKNSRGVRPASDPVSVPHENSFHGNLFFCNAGINSCWIDSTGMAHLCTSLRPAEFAYDLKTGTLKDYWDNIVPKLLGRCSVNPEFDNYCGKCPNRMKCRWCPALSWTEHRTLDCPVGFVCINPQKKS